LNDPDQIERLKGAIKEKITEAEDEALGE